jgi:HEAT repeat protein
VLKLVVAKDPDYWDPPKQYSNFTADDNERKYAIQALNQMKLEDEYFVQCAKDSVPGARDVLISKGAAIVPRMKALLNDNDKDTKQMALWVLMQVGPASAPAVPELIECVGTQEYRVPALLALSTIGPAAAPAIPTLIHTLLDEENRTTAIDALGNIGPAAKDAVPFLIDILQGKEQFTIKPPPPGYTYAYGEKLGNIGRMGMTVMQEFAAEGALKKIGTPEALQAVKDYEANKPK